MEDVQEFKIVLVGDGGVGKTAFLKRHLSGDFNNKYVPTSQNGGSKNWYSLTFHTNYGPLRFHVWDCAGSNKVPRLRKGSYAGAILMFSVTDRWTYKNLDTWNKWIDRFVQTKKNPVVKVVCGNKVDVGNRNRKVKVQNILWPRRNGYRYYEISAKSNHNFEKPFLYLGRKLTDHDDLRFVEEPAPLPPLLPIVRVEEEEVQDKGKERVEEEEESLEDEWADAEEEEREEEWREEGEEGSSTEYDLAWIAKCEVCGEKKELVVGDCCENEQCLQTYSAPCYPRKCVEEKEKEERVEEGEEKESVEESDFSEEITSDIQNLSKTRLKILAYYLGLKWSDTEDMGEIIVQHAKEQEMDEFPSDVLGKIDKLDEKQLKLLAYYLKLKWTEENMAERIHDRVQETNVKEEKEKDKEEQGWGCVMM